MRRYQENLSHPIFQCGHMGRLQTLTTFHCNAGESYEIDLEGVMRQAPMRRNLTVDAMVDLVVTEMPYRHVYGDDWKDFILGGIDEAVTFTSGTTPGAGDTPFYLGVSGDCLEQVEVPLYLTALYNRTWNRYFRNPTDTAGELADGDLITDSNGQRFGALCGRPKTPWTTGMPSAFMPDASDKDVTVSGGTFDVTDLSKIQARYKTEEERTWFGQRYNDILSSAFGSGANPDADERPRLVMRSQNWLSGYDVDGSGDATLGSYSGKSVSIVGLRSPRKFVPEHSRIGVFCLVRMPVIHDREIEWLLKKTQPTYAEISGDPTIVEEYPPEEMQVQDFFKSTSTTSLGYQPQGFQHRYHPAVVHENYRALQGFPFLRNVPNTINAGWYAEDNEFSDMFQTSQLGQWNCQMRCSIQKMGIQPPASRSIYAGT